MKYIYMMHRRYLKSAFYVIRYRFTSSNRGNGFLPSIVESEKRALLQRIEATYDDKMRYANERLIEEMCKVEPYRLSANGKKRVLHLLQMKVCINIIKKC